MRLTVLGTSDRHPVFPALRHPTAKHEQTTLASLLTAPPWPGHPAGSLLALSIQCSYQVMKDSASDSIHLHK